MKKFNILILSSALLFTLASCNNSKENETNNNVPASNEGNTNQGEENKPQEDNGNENQGNNNPGENPVDNPGGNEPGDDPTDNPGGNEPGDNPGHEENQEIELDLEINDSEFINVEPLNQKAKAGDNISFRITIKKVGYELESVSFKNGKNETLVATFENNVYTIAMPEDGKVIITPTYIGKTLKAYIFDEKANFSGDIYMTNANNEFVALGQPDYEEGIMFFNVIYGRKLKIKLKDNNYFLAKGIKFNGEEYLINANSEVEITLEKENLNNEFFSITILSEDTTPIEEGHVKLVIKNSEHISGKFYKEDLITQITTANEYETVYLKTTISDDEYSVKSITLSYKTSETSSTSTRDVNFDEEKQAYKFEVPYTYEGATITVTITEVSNSLAKDTGLTGEYFTFILSSASRQTFNIDETKILKIEDSGKITYNGKTVYASTIGENSIYTDNYNTLYYGDGMFLSDSDLKGPFTSYDVLGFKKFDKNDKVEDYQIKGERFVVDSKAYFVIEILYKNNAYATAFIENSSKKANFGVDFEYLYGNHFNDDKVIYNIKKGNQNLGSITWVNDGTYTDRAILESPFGVYLNDEHTLIIPNESVAIFDNENYAITFSENNVTLTNSSRKISISLDTTNMTFEITKDEEILDAKAPNFRNLAFNGVYIDEDDWETQIIIEFDNYESDSKITGTIYHGGKVSWGHPFGFEGTYNLDDNTLTVKIISEIYKEGFVAAEKTIRLKAQDGKLTGLDDLSSWYRMKNIVFTCSDFKL